jgi:DNA-binding transcriptional regulator YhcF (GntR family)
MGDDMANAGPFVYQKVKGTLTEMISSGRFKPGDKLPSERDLASQLGCNYHTVRKGLSLLETERWIERRVGSGTFVLPRAKANLDILLICSESCPPNEQMAVRVISGLLRKHEYNSYVIITKDPVEDWDTIIRQKPDALGCLILAPFSRRVMEAFVQQAGIPVVLIVDMDEIYHGPALCDTVLSDNRAMAYRATEYLIRQDHRRIALTGWQLEQKVWNRTMHQGYREALLANGIEPDPAWVVDLRPVPPDEEKPETIIAAQRQIDQWFKDGNPPTALIHSGNSEARVHDMLHLNFHGHFQNDAVVPIVPFELLATTYTGIRDAVAVVVKFEDLARRAIELLVRPKDLHASPTREIHAPIFLGRRKEGKWREEINEKE